MTISKLDEDWQEETNFRGEPWKYRDLSGEHLGVRIELLDPGATSSEHHFHTTEEEHLIILEGAGTLTLGEELVPIAAGDHMWFKAGVEDAHHIRNTSDAPLKFLVFGERKREDVVVYPEHKTMMVKAQDFKLVTYREVERDNQP